MFECNFIKKWIFWEPWTDFNVTLVLDESLSVLIGSGFGVKWSGEDRREIGFQQAATEKMVTLFSTVENCIQTYFRPLH